MSEDILTKSKEMISKEFEYAKELRELATKFRHPVLQVLLIGISLDSEKHSAFYDAIVKALTQTQPMLSEEELEVIKEGIKKHIEQEAEMVRLTAELLDKVSDPKLKLILQMIHDDEVRHHKLLLSLQKKIAEAETLTEADVWEMIWKDVAYHGAPGG